MGDRRRRYIGVALGQSVKGHSEGEEPADTKARADLGVSIRNANDELLWFDNETMISDIEALINDTFQYLDKYLKNYPTIIEIANLGGKLSDCDKTSCFIMSLLEINDEIESVGSFKINKREFHVDDFNIMLHNLILHNIILYQEISMRVMSFLTSSDVRSLIAPQKDTFGHSGEFSRRDEFLGLFNGHLRNSIAHADYELFGEPLENIQFFVFKSTKKDIEDQPLEAMRN